MALNNVNFGLNFSSTRSKLKPASFTFVNPFSTAKKFIGSDTSIRHCNNNDTALAGSFDVTSDEKSKSRRSGNYDPPIWDYDFLQSLTSNFQGDVCSKHASDLKENVRTLLNSKDMDILPKLELVNSLQRLGVCYHFEDEITKLLEAIFSNDDEWENQDLYAISLKFRLLRLHKFRVPQDVFKDFLDESGKFKASLRKDMKGVISLYEASYLSTKDEKIMDEARDFAKRHMKDYMDNINNKDEKVLGKLVDHALELPLRWREPRLEASWFIDFYKMFAPAEDIYASTVLEFAILDYNMVQSIYQDELKQMTRWWKSIEWGEKLSFARERTMECFYWSVGYNFKPDFGYGRRMLTAITAFITTIDDIYDVYGTLEELELLTKLTKRWDATELDQLPEYMQTCFSIFYNEINEIAEAAEKEHGVSILPYFQKVWTDLFEAYLLEARWYHSGYKPSLSEYLDNAEVSITLHVIFTHSYFLTASSITEEALQCLMTYPSIARLPATILRLADDLGGSRDDIAARTREGNVPKSIQCYMMDNGVSEEEAREHIKYLISEKWKELNEELLAEESPFSKQFIDMCLNLARISVTFYRHGDGHSAPTSLDKECLSLLFINPIPL